MTDGRYSIRPKADHDLEEQAYYYATVESPELGHRFFAAAHATFALLASQPGMGWHRQMDRADLASMRVFRVEGFEKILILYLPLPDGVEILRVVHGSRDLRAFIRRAGL